MPKTTKAKRKPARHPFIISYSMPGSNVDVEQKQFANVKTPRRGVDIVLTEQDVLRSIAAKGVGNTMTCSMAMCVNRLRHLFPHPVPPQGFIDWQYKTAFVVSKMNKRTNMPTECYRYIHNSEIAHINDSPQGQQQLLKMVRDAGGSITVSLRPRRRTDTTKAGGTGQRTGTRSTVVQRTTGAHARRRFVQLGLSATQTRTP